MRSELNLECNDDHRIIGTFTDVIDRIFLIHILGLRVKVVIKVIASIGHKVLINMHWGIIRHIAVAVVIVCGIVIACITVNDSIG